MKEKLCECCGVLFKVKISKFDKRRFCTSVCQNKSAIPWNKGKSKLELPQLSNAGRKIGDIPWNKGKKMPSITGENHAHWIQDRTKLAKRQERNDSTYKEWRRQVWLRDNFKCKMANPDCLGRIEAHHILIWSEYPELRYEVNNGITLCHAHHPRARAEEKRLAPYFMEIVSASIGK